MTTGLNGLCSRIKSDWMKTGRMIQKAKEKLLYENLTHDVIGAAMEVHRNLGPGFPEKIYERALKIELGEKKVPFETQSKIMISYKRHNLGERVLDA